MVWMHSTPTSLCHTFRCYTVLHIEVVHLSPVDAWTLVLEVLEVTSPTSPGVELPPAAKHSPRLLAREADDRSPQTKVSRQGWAVSVP